MWIVEDCSNLDYASLQTLIVNVLSTRLPTLSDEQRAEFSEEVELQVLNELYRRLGMDKDDGVVSNFEVSSEESTSYIRFIERPELTLLDTLRNATPKQFEQFCKKVLDTLGANAIVKGGPGDGGVDFFALDLPLNPYDIPSPPGGKALVVGQAKKYAIDNLVTEYELRSFVGASAKESFNIKRDHPSEIGIAHPTVLAFWTTSDFHTSARQFARDLGIWYLNGLALVQLANRLGIEDL